MIYLDHQVDESLFVGAKILCLAAFPLEELPMVYFGDTEDFRANLLNLGFKDGEIYDRVEDIDKKKQIFSIRWDIYNQITKDHILMLQYPLTQRVPHYNKFIVSLSLVQKMFQNRCQHKRHQKPMPYWRKR